MNTLRFSRFAAFTGLAFLATLVQAQPTPTPSGKPAEVYTPIPLKVPSKNQFDLYLLIGQSNMLGRDTSKLAEQVDNDHIGGFDGRGNWTIAREPLWGGSGTGPGLSFAAAMLATRPAGVKIGLIPSAVGGSPLSQWVKGGPLYERALARAKLAMKTGTLKGILWHQGESDSDKPELASTYEARLTQMLSDLRADLGQPNLPVVIGQLGMFLVPKNHAQIEVVRAAIVKVSHTAPHVGFADSEGLKHKGDVLHFDAASEIEFGRRYARSMLTLQAK